METGRKRSKSEAKRRLLLKAAAQLFLEQGFDNTSMDAIAERAGVSKQTAYSHFGNKEGIFAAALESKTMDYALDRSLLEDDRPMDQVLMDLGQHFLSLLLNEEAIRVMRLCCAPAEEPTSIAMLYYEKGPEAMIDVLSQYLGKQNELGVIHIPNLRFAAEQFIYMIHAREPMRRHLGLPPQNTVADLEPYIESCVHLFLRGYEYRP